MTGDAPPFWWGKPGWQAWLLSPFSFLYGMIARWRMEHARPAGVPVPVLCVGNFTVGGSGKTPTVIALAKAARDQGLKPGFLSRGHGGSFSKPHLVDPDHDNARHTGDEPLLLSSHAPVAISSDRHAAAELLHAQGCDFLIMDDGFQSRRIAFDYSLLVVDARRGLGNGYIIPAGPVRAPVVAQLRHADALLVAGSGTASDQLVRLAARAARPVFHAQPKPRQAKNFKGRRFCAFAGIGEPLKFYDMLELCGAELAATRNFPDHHQYLDDDLMELKTLAQSHDATLITTQKDAVRLQGGSPLASEMLSGLEILVIDMVFDDPGIPKRMIRDTLEAFRQRRLSA